jgi:hypothetical protein
MNVEHCFHMRPEFLCGIQFLQQRGAFSFQFGNLFLYEKLILRKEPRLIVEFLSKVSSDALLYWRRSIEASTSYRV